MYDRINYFQHLVIDLFNKQMVLNDRLKYNAITINHFQHLVIDLFNKQMVLNDRLKHNAITKLGYSVIIIRFDIQLHE